MKEFLAWSVGTEAPLSSPSHATIWWFLAVKLLGDRKECSNKIQQKMGQTLSKGADKYFCRVSSLC